MDFQVLGNYINGQFSALKGDAEGELTNLSPADLSDSVGEFKYSFQSVDRAVDSARKAFINWQLTPLEERKKLLIKFKSILEKNHDRLEKIICREVGKPSWETKIEIKSIMSKIDITLKEGLDVIKPFEVLNAARSALGRCRYKPRGVLAVLGPFNFPAHLPNGHIIPALATGNCIIFKPSELTPGTGQVYAEIIHQVGFPPGVFNLVQGEGRIGGYLAKHPNIDGILFTGSYDTGFKIQQETFHDYWKIRALEMGGKNATIVLQDADINKALAECIVSSNLTTGQRCSATSRIILHKEIATEFIEKFHNLSKDLLIDHPYAEKFGRKTPFMGPLINDKAQEKYLKFQDMATREGAEKIMRGKTLERKPNGYYVSPSIYLIKEPNPKSVFQQTELFAPCTAIYIIENLEQALEIANQTSYGLTLSVFTANESNYEKVFQLCRTGLVNWNTGTVGSSSKLPFGGILKSGNDRPTALYATQYCTYPVAELIDSSPLDTSQLPPGFNWKEK